jgi:hypothetical protein
MKGSKKRWKNISEIFEKITAKYPDEDLYIQGSFKEGISANCEKSSVCSFSKAATKKLKKMPDIAIAEKMKAVYRALTLEDKALTAIDKILKNVPAKERNITLDYLLFNVDNMKQCLLEGDRFFKMKDSNGLNAVNYKVF